MRTRLSLLVLALAWSESGCSIGETTYEEVVLPLRPSTEIVTCSSPFVKPDLGRLKTCHGERGKGHCYDATRVPIPRAQLEPCDGDEVCVPDALLTANGTKAKSCTFFYDGKPGACVSTLRNWVHDNRNVLKQDGCEADERCIPCIDPRTGKDTSLCAPTGVHEASCVGGSGVKPIPCCHAMGECVVEKAVPEEVRSTMIRDSCKDGRLCAPISQLDAKPVKCSVLGASGVCLDVCFARDLQGTTALTRGGCGPTELCLPCFLANASGDDRRLIGCD